MFQHACMCVHVCGLVNDTVISGDCKLQMVGWIQIWRDMEGSNHSPIWCTIPTFLWRYWDKPQETWFRIVSLWAQIWIQTFRMQSRSADTSTVMFGPDFYHLFHCYTWPGLLVLHTVWSVTWVQFCRLCVVWQWQRVIFTHFVLCACWHSVMFFIYIHWMYGFYFLLNFGNRERVHELSDEE